MKSLTSLLKKIGIGLLVMTALFTFAQVALAGSFVETAHAQTPTTPVSDYDPVPPGGGIKDSSICDIGFNLGKFPSCVLYWVTYAITTIIAFFVAVAAFLAEFALRLSNGVVASPVVQAGFRISLALANLGFVLGIIVIAIATILRMQSYGIKQLLFKLVAMAILVNFSMVLASSILNFSDSLSRYFIENASPTGTELGKDDFEKAKGFVAVMAQGFGPQELYRVTTGSSGGAAAADAVTANTYGMLGATFASVLNMFFIVAFMSFVFLAFLVLAIMLLIRYVFLALLLIAMPLAWMAWVFPALKKHHTKWWNDFIQWVFFAPAVLFFIYLAMLTMSGSPAYKTYADKYYVINPQDGAAAAITKVIGGNVSQTLGSLGQMIITLGLVFGGFFAAKKLGGATAAATMGAAKAGVMWAGQKAGARVIRRATTAPTAPPTTARGRLWNKLTLKGTMAQKDLGDLTSRSQRARRLADDAKAEADRIGRGETSTRFGSGEEALARARAREKRFEEIARAAEKKVKKGTASNERRKWIADQGKKMQDSPGLARSLWLGGTGGYKAFRKAAARHHDDDHPPHPPAPPTPPGGPGPGPAH